MSMTREDFIKAIEARGLTNIKHGFGAPAGWKRETILYAHAFLATACLKSTTTGRSFNNIPYSAITEELINAVAGPQRSEE